MKIDRKKIVNRCGYDQNECMLLAKRLSECPDETLIAELRQISVWNYGKCELGLWANVLDRLDAILEHAVTKVGKWMLLLDLPENASLVDDVVTILEFTGHLIEHSIYRYLYGSWNHILALFGSENMDILLAVLGLSYNFSKRSNYFSRLDPYNKKMVLDRLVSIAETWGGTENNFGLAACCDPNHFPETAGNVYFEYRPEHIDSTCTAKPPSSTELTAPTSEVCIDASIHGGSPWSTNNTIVLQALHRRNQSPSEIMEDLLAHHPVPPSKQMALFARIRLATYFSNPVQRHKCIRARLQALSILSYTFEVDERHLYPSLLDELVEVLELSDDQYTGIKACALRTMTAIINSHRLGVNWTSLVGSTGLSSYHGILPKLTRKWIHGLVNNSIDAPGGSMNQQFTTALLSFLYHLACYEENVGPGNTQNATLNSCGVLDTMLQLISWHTSRNDYLSYVTRAVRVTDQILMSIPFSRQNVVAILVDRLRFEVELVLNSASDVKDSLDSSPLLNTQRSGLMKSILNLLKRLCLDTEWGEVMHSFMDGTLPDVLRQIFLNGSTHFTPHLALFAMECITNYIYTYPSHLSAMQDKNVTTDILTALARQPLPQNRDFLVQLPGLFNTLALNARGIEAVQSSGVLSQYLETLVSPEYLGTMKTKRVRDFLSQIPYNLTSNTGQSLSNSLTASQMSNAIQELLRSRSELKPTVFQNLVSCLRRVVELGRVQPASLIIDATCPGTSTPIGPDTDHKLSQSMGPTCQHLDTVLPCLTSCALGTACCSSLASGSMAAEESGRSGMMLDDDVVMLSGGEDEDDDDDNDIDDLTRATQTHSATHPARNIARMDSRSASPAPSLNSKGTEPRLIGSKALVSPDDSPLLPSTFLPDFMLNTCKFLEKLLPSVLHVTEAMCRHFMSHGGLQVLCDLLCMPGLPYDFPVSAACASLCKIFEDLANSIYLNDVIDPLFQCLESSLEKLKPLQKSEPTVSSVLLREYVAGEHTLLHELVVTASVICIMVQIIDHLKPELRPSLANKWIGRNMLQTLGRLYIGVSWEAGILLKLLFGDKDITETEMQIPSRTVASDGAQPQASSSTKPLSAPNDSTTSTWKPVTEINPVPQFVEALHIFSLLKPSKPPVEDNKDAFLHSRPDLAKATHRILHVTAFLINSFTELCTTWERFFANRNQSTYRRRRMTLLPCEQIPSSTKYAALSQISHVLSDTLAWEASSSIRCHPSAPSLICAMRYAAIRLTNNLMLGSSQKGLQGGLLNAFLAVNGIRRYFGLFRELISFDLTDPHVREPLAVVLEEWLACADRLSTAENGGNESSRTSDSELSLVHTTNQSSFVHQHMLFSLEQLCIRSDLQNLLTKAAVEHLLNMLISVVPYLFDTDAKVQSTKPTAVAFESVSDMSRTTTNTTIQPSDLHADQNIAISVEHSSPAVDSQLPIGDATGWNLPVQDTPRPTVALCSRPDSPVPAPIFTELPAGDSGTIPIPLPMDTSESEQSESESDPRAASALLLLEEMGFSRQLATVALEQTGWNTNEAVNLLIATPEQELLSSISHQNPLSRHTAGWTTFSRSHPIRRRDVVDQANLMSDDNYAYRSASAITTAAMQVASAASSFIITTEGDIDRINTAARTTNLDAPQSVTETISTPPVTISTIKLNDDPGPPIEVETLAPEVIDSLRASLKQHVFRACYTIAEKHHSDQILHRIAELLLSSGEEDRYIDELFGFVANSISERLGMPASPRLPSSFPSRSNMDDHATTGTAVKEHPTVGLHLAALLFTRCHSMCARLAWSHNFPQLLVSWISHTASKRSLARSSFVPPASAESSREVTEAGGVDCHKTLLLASLILDQYMRSVQAMRLRRQSTKLYAHSHSWNWFDDRAMLWHPYTTESGRIIDTAFHKGDTCAFCHISRKPYAIEFPTMTQVNLDSMHRRPVMLFPAVLQEAVDSQEKESAAFSSYETSISDGEIPPDLTHEQQKTLLFALLDLFKSASETRSVASIPSDCVNAMLRLLLRLAYTSYDNACEMVDNDVLTILLNFPHVRMFTAEYSAFVGALLTQIFEDASTVSYVMKEVFTKMCQFGVPSTFMGIGATSTTCRDLFYLLGMCVPMFAKDHALAHQVARETIVLSLTDADVLAKTLPKNYLVEVPKSTTTNGDKFALSDRQQRLLTILIEAISSSPAGKEASRPVSVTVLRPEDGESCTQLCVTPYTTVLNTTVPSTINVEIATGNNSQRSTVDSQQISSDPITSTSSLTDASTSYESVVLGKTDSIRFLIDLVASYQAVAEYLAFYGRKLHSASVDHGQHTSSFLSHLFTYELGHGETTELATTLLENIMLVGSESTQDAVINELKASLSRISSSAHTVSSSKQSALHQSDVVQLRKNDRLIAHMMFLERLLALPPTFVDRLTCLIYRRHLPGDIAKLIAVTDCNLPNTQSTLTIILRTLESLTWVDRQLTRAVWSNRDRRSETTSGLHSERNADHARSSHGRTESSFSYVDSSSHGDANAPPPPSGYLPPSSRDDNSYRSADARHFDSDTDDDDEDDDEDHHNDFPVHGPRPVADSGIGNLSEPTTSNASLNLVLDDVLMSGADIVLEQPRAENRDVTQPWHSTDDQEGSMIFVHDDEDEGSAGQGGQGGNSQDEDDVDEDDDEEGDDDEDDGEADDDEEADDDDIDDDDEDDDDDVGGETDEEIIADDGEVALVLRSGSSNRRLHSTRRRRPEATVSVSVTTVRTSDGHEPVGSAIDSTRTGYPRTSDNVHDSHDDGDGSFDNEELDAFENNEDEATRLQVLGDNSNGAMFLTTDEAALRDSHPVVAMVEEVLSMVDVPTQGASTVGSRLASGRRERFVLAPSEFGGINLIPSSGHGGNWGLIMPRFRGSDGQIRNSSNGIGLPPNTTVFRFGLGNGNGASVFVTDGNNNRFGGVNLVASSSGVGTFGSSQTLTAPTLSSQHPLLQIPSSSATASSPIPSASSGGVRLSRTIVANTSAPFSRLNSALPPMPPVSTTTSTYHGQRNRAPSSFIGPILVGNSGIRQRGPPTRLYAPFSTDSAGYRPYSPGVESGSNPAQGVRVASFSDSDLSRDNRAGPEADALVWSMLTSIAEDQPSSVNSALASAIFSQVAPTSNGNRPVGSGSGPNTSQLATYAGYALPASYRRWITMARMLFGHELMDLVLISRYNLYQDLSKRRQESFKKRLLEAEKSACAQPQTTSCSTEALAQPGTQTETVPTTTVAEFPEGAQDSAVPVLRSGEESQLENQEPFDPHPSPVVLPCSSDADVTSVDHVDRTGTSDETETATVRVSTSESTTQPSTQPVSVVASVPMTDEETIQSLVEGGMDPSFLDALPEEMRREVIADHRHARQVQQQLNSLSLPEHINADWLTGLPTHIQEEVLTQFRQEQQRLLQQPAPIDSTAATGGDSTRSTDVVAGSRPAESNTAFLVSLPTSLRREVLADMDESQLDTLPADLAAEARQLRRENEERFARVVQGNMLTHSFSSRHDQDIWRNLTSTTGLIGGPGRWDVRFNSINQFLRHINSAFGGRPSGNALVGSQSLPSTRGRHMMDHEALTCLVALLIVSSTCSQQRRHVVPILRKVLRNLSCHLGTRNWIIGTLLSLFEGLSDKPEKDGNCFTSQRLTEFDHPSLPNPTNTIFHLGFEAALGCWVRVFHPISTPAPCSTEIDHVNRRSLKDRPTVTGIERSACPSSSRAGAGYRHYIVHPQAAVCVSSVLLETLSELAKAFPSQFYPRPPSDQSDEASSSESSPAIEWPTPAFWELFERLSESHAPTITSHLKSGRRGHGSAKKRDSSSFNKPFSEPSQTVPLGPTIERNVEHTSTVVPMEISSPDVSSTTAPTPPHIPRRLAVPAATVEYFVHLSNLLCHPLVQDRTSHQERLLTILAGVIKEFISNRASAGDASTPSASVNESGQTSHGDGRRPGTTISNDTPSDPGVVAPVGEPASSTELSQSRPQQETHSSVDLIAPLRTEVVKILCQFVLAPKSTESGRNMAAQLITDLARANRVTKDFMLRLLSEFADQLIRKLCSQLQDLVDEINSSPSKTASSSTTPGPSSSWPQPPRSCPLDVLPDRFAPSGQYVVVSGESRSDAPTGFSEMHLKSVQPLSCPGNDQSRLRGILGLIVRLSAGESSVNATDPVAVPAQDPSESIPSLRDFWPRLSIAFERLQTISDPNSVLLLQPLLEAFCLAHLFLVKDSVMIRQRSLTPRSNRTNSGAANTGVHSLIDMVPMLQLRVEPSIPSNDRPEIPGSSSSEQTTHLHMDIVGPTSPPMPTEDDKTADDVTFRRMSDISSSGNPILQFAERHRNGLNQVLRQNSSSLGESPFAVFLVYSRVLDFDIKRRFFRQQLQSLSPRSTMSNRYDDEPIVISRDRIFEDSYARLHRRSAAEWKHKFVIRFQNEEGQDAGGPLREWYLLMSREIFNPNYCLFRTSPADRVTYTINPSSYINSNHLSYFKFVGRFIAKAIYDNKLLECYFSRSFYKHILGVPVKCSDLESDDYEFYKGLEFLLKNHVSDLGYDLTFSTEINEFGKTETRDLIEDGRNVQVTEQNKKEYVRLVCQERMTGAIRQQLDAFLGGFYEIIPKRMISIFNEQELELLISGLPNIDIADLKANTTYSKYQCNSPQIEWFWCALESLEQEDLARFLQFVTGTSKVPLGGFANLEGMHGPTKFQISRASVSSTKHLPCAHTCFNTLVLPAYESYDQLRSRLLVAIRECSEGYGMT